MAEMIYQKVVELIQQNADSLTKRLMRDILGREETKSYRTLPERDLYWRVFDVYSRLDSWLSKDKEKGDIKRHYIELGKQRYHESIPLSDLVMTLLLIKRHLWIFVMENQFFDSSFELSRALELNNKVVLFFDRAIYFAVLGYEDEMRKEMKKAV
jgi:hypothetical protein